MVHSRSQQEDRATKTLFLASPILPAFDPLRLRLKPGLLALAGGFKSMPRPTLPESERRDYILKVRFSGAELEEVESSADLAGLPVSTFIRTAALGLPMKPRPTRMNAEAIRQLAAVGNNINQLAHQANAGKFPSEVRLNEALDELITLIRDI